MVFCDDDYVGNQDDCKYWTKNVFIFGNVVIAWCSQCLSCIANSTTIFEFVVANEVIFKKSLAMLLTFQYWH
jgi:hypothetical protein